MDRSERLRQLRADVAHAEGAFKERDKVMAEYLARVKKDPAESFDPKYDDTELPPLPAPVPLPDYANAADPISQEDTALDFYAACSHGRLDEVVEFFELHGPNQGTRQYGLERACRYNHADVARYLLDQGTILHANALNRFHPRKDDPVSVQMLEVFIKSGWHPNQVWESSIYPNFALLQWSWTDDRPLFELLLKSGINPNLHYSIAKDGGKIATCKHGFALQSAIRTWDTSLIDLLIAYGARPKYAHLLHSVADWTMSMKPVSFSHRRPVAEHLLNRGIAHVNELKDMAISSGYAGPPSISLETPFSYACLAQDWEFAEWLLEHGADPDALDRKAFQQRSIYAARVGQMSPVQVTKLVEKVKLRQATSELETGR